MQRWGGDLTSGADAAPTHRPQKPRRGTGTQRQGRDWHGSCGAQDASDFRPFTTTQRIGLPAQEHFQELIAVLQTRGCGVVDVRDKWQAVADLDHSAQSNPDAPARSPRPLPDARCEARLGARVARFETRPFIRFGRTVRNDENGEHRGGDQPIVAMTDRCAAT